MLFTLFIVKRSLNFFYHVAFHCTKLSTLKAHICLQLSQLLLQQRPLKLARLHKPIWLPVFLTWLKCIRQSAGSFQSCGYAAVFKQCLFSLTFQQSRHTAKPFGANALYLSLFLNFINANLTLYPIFELRCHLKTLLCHLIEGACETPSQFAWYITLTKLALADIQLSVTLGYPMFCWLTILTWHKHFPLTILFNSL